MKIFVILALCLAVVSAVEINLDKHWAKFKAVHSKKYPNREHETLRRAIFNMNMKKIIEHNMNSAKSYKLAINQFADLTGVEFRNLMLATKFDAFKASSSNDSDLTHMTPLNYEAPDSVDWRTKGYVTPVKNQGQCGSCWAFSATGSLEGQHFRKTGKLVSLSEQQLVDCSKFYGNNGCRGGLMDNGFKYIKDNQGIDTETTYPYTARDGSSCHFNKQNVGATVAGFVDVKRGSETDLQNAVASVGPVSVAIDASNLSFQFYQSGVYDEVQCSSTKLDHGVLVVGYGTENNVPYWLVKNSWGPGWGENGYIKMSRNRSNQCGIASMASYPLV